MADRYLVPQGLSDLQSCFPSREGVCRRLQAGTRSCGSIVLDEFFERIATARDLSDVNIAAGIASNELQGIEEEIPEQTPTKRADCALLLAQ
jgi:hypothetical protein